MLNNTVLSLHPTGLKELSQHAKQYSAELAPYRTKGAEPAC
jgi:hypothetical protein